MKDEKYSTDVTMNIIGTPIQVHNCDGLCSHEFCGSSPTHYFNVKINGVPLFVSVCEEHMKDIEERPQR